MKYNLLSLCRALKLLSLFLVAQILCACAPLQQAPLVYTSGVTVGVKVGVSPTQADSFETVIGFKMLDAAYVPVAVSKPDSDGADRNKAQVHEIYGRFGEEITPDAVRQLSATETQSVQLYLTAVASFREGQRVANIASKNYDDLKLANEQTIKAIQDAKAAAEEAQRTILALRNTAPGVCNFDNAQLGLGSNQWQDINLSGIRTTLDFCLSNKPAEAAEKDFAALKKASELLKNPETQSTNPAALLATQKASAKVMEEALASRTAAEVSVKAAKDTLESREKSAMEALQKLANIRKRDALSVYGSFNGGFNQGVANNGPKIDSKLGKVFSTGIAAQNLTEATKFSVITEAYSNCVSILNASAAFILESDKAAFIQREIPKCGDGAKAAVTSK